MANSNFVPLAGCEASAAERQTAYALSVCHLFLSTFSPDPSNILADYTAKEANYTTYAPITFTAWMNPILAPGSGFVISSPAIQFETGAVDPAVGNLIGGFWMEDAGGALRLAGIFDPPIPMQVAYQGIPLQLFDLFNTGQ